MIYIKPEGQPAIFIDMVDHYDVGSPSFSPDGKLIAFDAKTIGDAPIRESWLVSAEGKNLRKLFNGATPRWFPDGAKVTFTRSRRDAINVIPKAFVFEYDLATKKEKQLCEGRLADWSADGKRIAFARGGQLTENGGTHSDSLLFIAKVDGSDAEEVCRGDWPSWSPDGKKLAFVRHGEGEPPIVWVMDLESKRRQRLGTGFYRPQWSGDSLSVLVKAYMATEAGTSLAAMPARLFLAKDRVEYFGLNLDNPWAPCVSRDGKTMAMVVDSDKPSESGSPTE